MVRYCSVKFCKNKSKPSRTGISFFRYPHLPLMVDQWIENTHSHNLIEFNDPHLLHQKYHVCSEHFEDDMFIHTGVMKRLRSNAVPTLFNAEILSEREKEQKVVNESLMNTLPRSNPEQIQEVPKIKELEELYTHASSASCLSHITVKNENAMSSYDKTTSDHIINETSTSSFNIEIPQPSTIDSLKKSKKVSTRKEKQNKNQVKIIQEVIQIEEENDYETPASSLNHITVCNASAIPSYSTIPSDHTITSSSDTFQITAPPCNDLKIQSELYLAQIIRFKNREIAYLQKKVKDDTQLLAQAYSVEHFLKLCDTYLPPNLIEQVKYSIHYDRYKN